MPEVDKGEKAKVPPHKVALRGAAAILLPFFPAKVIDNYGSEERMSELENKGYGAIEALRHLSFGEVIRWFPRRGFRGSRIWSPYVAPLAHHQVNDFFMKGGRAFGLDVVRIVTQRTLELEKDFDENGRKLPLGYGSTELLKKGREVLRHGGRVHLHPQATRTEKFIYNPTVLPTQKLIQFCLKDGVDKVAVRSTGFYFEGSQEGVYSSEEFGGFNPGLLYTFVHGPTETIQELIARAGGIDNVEQTVLNDLQRLSIAA